MRNESDFPARAAGSSRSSASRRRAALATAIMAFLPMTPRSVNATVYTYTPVGGASDQWSAGTDWSSGGVTPIAPSPAVTTELQFGLAATASLASGQTDTNTDNNAGAFQLNIMDLDGTASSSGSATININSGTGSDYLDFITNGGTNPTVNLNAVDTASGKLYFNINAPITLDNDTTFTGTGTAIFSIAGSISGTGALIKSSAGSLTLTGNNSYGLTTLNTGTLFVGTGGTLGSGNVSIASTATLDFARGSGDTYILSNTASGSGRILVTSAGTLELTANNSSFTGVIGAAAANATIEAFDSSPQASGPVTLPDLLGNGSSLTMINNTSLVFRINGDGTAIAQTLTVPTSSSNGIFLTGSAAAITIDVGAATSNSGNANKTIGIVTNAVVGSTYTVTNSTNDGYGLLLTKATIGGGASTGTQKFVPSTTLTIGNIVNSNTSTGIVLNLDGTSSSNQITGTIPDNSGTGTLSVLKTNSSTWTLSGSAAYSGGTTINGGTLVAGYTTNSSTASSFGVGSVTLTTGTLASTAAATSYIKGAVTANGGTIAPGGSGSIGSLTLASTLALNSGSTLSVDVGTSASDLVTATGGTTLGDTLAVSLQAGATPSSGTVYTILNSPGGLSGAFSNIAAGNTISVAGGTFVVDYEGSGSSSATSVVLDDFTSSSTPEPASLGVFAIAGLMLGRRRKRQQIAPMPVTLR